MVEEDLVRVEELTFYVRDDAIVCRIEGLSLFNYDISDNHFIFINFSVCENGVIDWCISYPNLVKHFTKFRKITPKFKIYNIKKIKIENTSDVIHEEELSLNFYANEECNKFFLSLSAGDKEDIKDITNIRNGDEIEFKLQGEYYTLFFTVKFIL